MRERAPFRPVSLGVDDTALEDLARAKGVGAMMPVSPQPSPAPQARAEQGAPALEVPLVTAPASVEPPVAAPPPTPRSRMRSIAIELPDDAWTALKIKAAREHVSVRHLVMLALAAQGIEFRPEDMIEDGRRIR